MTRYFVLERPWKDVMRDLYFGGVPSGFELFPEDYANATPDRDSPQVKIFHDKRADFHLVAFADMKERGESDKPSVRYDVSPDPDARKLEPVFRRIGVNGSAIMEIMDYASSASR